MLSLEITDYEKKLADANEKLEEQQKIIETQVSLLEEKDIKIQTWEQGASEIEDALGDLKKTKELLQV
jgi:multidrug resistance efflux pump